MDIWLYSINYLSIGLYCITVESLEHVVTADAVTAAKVVSLL